MKNILIILLVAAVSIAFGQKNPRDLNLKWKTDTTNTSVDLQEFTALMYADEIPSIDTPAFYKADKAFDEYFEFEPVIAVEVNGESKAYPLSVLMYHEIVNDSIGGMSIAVTYCPLCNSAVVFNRQLTFKGKNYHLDFGVSGMLRRSDMVMYDRQTESWWQQFTGAALVGELEGAELEFIPAPVISLEEFQELYPGGRVLAKERTSAGKDEHAYGNNPYVGYDALSNERPRLFHEEVDSRMPAMTRVVDVIIQKTHRVYRLAYIREQGILNDNFKDIPVAVFYSEKVVSVLDSADFKKSKTIGAVNVFWANANGINLSFKKKKDYFIDKETKSKWNMKGECFAGKLKGEKLPTLPHGQHFAFALFTFHPDADLYDE